MHRTGGSALKTLLYGGRDLFQFRAHQKKINLFIKKPRFSMQRTGGSALKIMLRANIKVNALFRVDQFTEFFSWLLQLLWASSSNSQTLWWVRVPKEVAIRFSNMPGPCVLRPQKRVTSHLWLKKMKPRLPLAQPKSCAPPARSSWRSWVGTPQSWGTLWLWMVVDGIGFHTCDG